MAGIDFDVELKQLRATMRTIGQVLDPDHMRAEIADLGEQVAAPDLWDDQDNATRVTGRLSALQGQLDRFTELDGRLDDVEIMVQLSQEENDASSLSEAESELGRIHKSVEALEVRTLLSGEYDVREALLTIRSGAGGVSVSTRVPDSTSSVTTPGLAAQGTLLITKSGCSWAINSAGER